jgi:hypothetical protein
LDLAASCANQRVRERALAVTGVAIGREWDVRGADDKMADLIGRWAGLLEQRCATNETPEEHAAVLEALKVYTRVA